MRAFFAIIAVFCMTATGAAVGQQSGSRSMEVVFLDVPHEDVTIFVNGDQLFTGSIKENTDGTGPTLIRRIKVTDGPNLLSIRVGTGKSDYSFDVVPSTKRILVYWQDGKLQVLPDEAEVLLLD